MEQKVKPINFTLCIIKAINYSFQLWEIKKLPLSKLINNVIKAYEILINECLKFQSFLFQVNNSLSPTHTALLFLHLSVFEIRYFSFLIFCIIVISTCPIPSLLYIFIIIKKPYLGLQ